jgi:hypothetical protein
MKVSSAMFRQAAKKMTPITTASNPSISSDAMISAARAAPRSGARRNADHAAPKAIGVPKKMAP